MPAVCPPFWLEACQGSGKPKPVTKKSEPKQQILTLTRGQLNLEYSEKPIVKAKSTKSPPVATAIVTSHNPKGIKVIGSRPPDVPPNWHKTNGRRKGLFWNGWTQQWMAKDLPVERQFDEFMKMARYMHSVGLWPGQGEGHPGENDKVQAKIERNLAVWQLIGEPKYNGQLVGVWVEQWRLLLPPVLKRKRVGS